VLKSYRKNILREMKDNLSRMVSLFGIVALGVMMLTGLMSFAPSMRIAGQKYYVQQNVFDLRVLSTLGLSEEDIAAIAAVDGVEAVQPVKYQDVEAQWQGQSETAVVRLQQLPADPGADTAENNGVAGIGGTGPRIDSRRSVALPHGTCSEIHPVMTYYRFLSLSMMFRSRVSSWSISSPSSWAMRSSRSAASLGGTLLPLLSVKAPCGLQYRIS